MRERTVIRSELPMSARIGGSVPPLFLLALRMVAVAGGQNGCHERQDRFWDPFQGSNGAAAGAFLAGFVVLPQPSVQPTRPGHQPMSRETVTRAAMAWSRLYGGPMASVKQFQVTFD